MSKGRIISKVRLVANLGEHMLVLEKHDGTFSLPGGRVKNQETGVQALVREVKEETGFIVDKKHLKYLCTEVNDKSNKSIHTSYYTYDRKGNSVKNKEEEKFKSVKWSVWFEVSDYLDKEDQKAVLTFFSKKEYIN